MLTLLFMKYVSDKYAGDDEFADITVPPGGSFADMVALKGTKEIGDRINKVIGRLADANDHLLKGVIDLPDFNDETKLGKGKEMQDRLTKLVGIFEGLDFRANRAHGDDLLGDAYEYLMRHFATQSGKSKGQFYTPAEVSRIMARVIGIGADARLDQTVYDPTCGSGSLLIKAADAAPIGLTIYGQEKDVATWTMARMNLILHGREAAEIGRDNTLTAPQFTDGPGRLKRFDFAVANPPFSDKAWTNGLNPAHDEYRRFDHGEPPAKNGDYAYLLHLVASLRSTGKGQAARGRKARAGRSRQGRPLEGAGRIRYRARPMTARKPPEQGHRRTTCQKATKGPAIAPNTSPNTSPKTSPKTSPRLPQRPPEATEPTPAAERILAVLRAEPGITQFLIAERLGMSVTGVK